jgi:CBS domain containing-hemolysin-like protein
VNLHAMLWLTVASALVSCLTAIGARSLREYSRHDLQEICHRRRKPNRCGEISRDGGQVVLGVEMVVVLAATLAITAGTLWGWQRLALSPPAPWWLPLVMAALSGLAITVGVVCIPWTISRVGGAAFLFHTWPFWKLLSTLIRPLVWCACGADWMLHRMAGIKPQQPDEESFGEEIRTIVTEGHREGLLEEDAREMIEGVIELGDADVAHIMTPRTEMHMVRLDTPWDEMLQEVIALGHTRIPVFNKSRDDIVGILYSKDLLPELAKGPDQPRKPLAELLRKPQFVPETKPVDDLIEFFQQTRTHIAVVLDEYGGVAGMVTIDDALEEIVGEIADEYDQEVEDVIRKVDDNVCEALGRAQIDRINEEMAFHLPEDEDFDTVGGFVFAEFGRVPVAGESITWRDSVRITVLEASRRRVNRVRLERVQSESLEIA